MFSVWLFLNFLYFNQFYSFSIFFTLFVSISDFSVFFVFHLSCASSIQLFTSSRSFRTPNFPVVYSFCSFNQFIYLPHYLFSSFLCLIYSFTYPLSVFPGLLSSSTSNFLRFTFSFLRFIHSLTSLLCLLIVFSVLISSLPRFIHSLSYLMLLAVLVSVFFYFTSSSTAN